MTRFILKLTILFVISITNSYAVTIEQAWATCSLFTNSVSTTFNCQDNSAFLRVERWSTSTSTGTTTKVGNYTYHTSCPVDTVFNSSTGTCYQPCNTNSVLDLVNPYTIHWQTQGSGTLCIDNSLTCNPPSTINFELRECNVPPTPQCIGQQTLNLATNQCESPQCSSNMTLDPVTQVCRITCQGDDNPDYSTNTCSPPVCPVGYTYSMETHTCTANPDPTCLPTQHLENHLCTDPTCFAPSVLNPSTHACEVPTPDPGTGDPGTGDPGTGDPGTGDPGTGDPGTGDPGTGDPGTGDPGTGDPGTDPSTAQSYSNSHGDTSFFDLAAVEQEKINVKGEYSSKINQIYNSTHTIMITSSPYDLPTIHMFDMNGTSVDIDLSTYGNFFDKIGYVFVFIATCMAIMILLE